MEEADPMPLGLLLVGIIVAIIVIPFLIPLLVFIAAYEFIQSWA